MDHITIMDFYCERVTPGFWNEPFNAVSNLAFFISCLLIHATARKHGQSGIRVWLLILLIAAFGTGSFLFHTFATYTTWLLDIIPILLFQFVFFWNYLRLVMAFSPLVSTSILLIYFLFALFCRQFPDVLNGSVFYAPPFFMLLILGIYHYQSDKHGRYLMLQAFLIFLFALTIRTLDAAVCPYFPIGTHFLWHLANAMMIYLLVKGLIVNLPSK